MIDKFCTYLTNKIRKEMPEVDDERAEVINYGIQLIIGEIPKIILLFAIAFILRVGWLTMFAFFAILPYKKYSGGFHLKTHFSFYTSGKSAPEMPRLTGFPVRHSCKTQPRSDC